MSRLESASAALVAMSLVLTTFTAVAASPPQQRGEFKDPRGNQPYPTVEIAGMTWLARDLNYKTADSYCYEEKPENSENYSRLCARLVLASEASAVHAGIVKVLAAAGRELLDV
jgi:hypothetical protein